MGVDVLRGNCPTNRGSCPIWVIVLGVVVLGGNCPWGSCPVGVIVLGGSCPLGSCPRGSCPRGSCPRTMAPNAGLCQIKMGSCFSGQTIQGV